MAPLAFPFQTIPGPEGGFSHCQSQPTAYCVGRRNATKHSGNQRVMLKGHKSGQYETLKMENEERLKYADRTLFGLLTLPCKQDTKIHTDRFTALCPKRALRVPARQTKARGRHRQVTHSSLGNPPIGVSLLVPFEEPTYNKNKTWKPKKRHLWVLKGNNKKNCQFALVGFHAHLKATQKHKIMLVRGPIVCTGVMVGNGRPPPESIPTAPLRSYNREGVGV